MESFRRLNLDGNLNPAIHKPYGRAVEAPSFYDARPLSAKRVVRAQRSHQCVPCSPQAAPVTRANCHSTASTRHQTCTVPQTSPMLGLLPFTQCQGLLNCGTTEHPLPPGGWSIAPLLATTPTRSTVSLHHCSATATAGLARRSIPAPPPHVPSPTHPPVGPAGRRTSPRAVCTRRWPCTAADGSFRHGEWRGCGRRQYWRGYRCSPRCSSVLQCATSRKEVCQLAGTPQNAQPNLNAYLDWRRRLAIGDTGGFFG